MALIVQGCSGPSPSVLLVVVDTLRADRTGASSGEAPEQAPPSGMTPVLDRWMNGAAVFRGATTPAPLTVPAMAATLTGVYPDRCGVVEHEPGTSLDSWKGDTLAEAATRAGLETAAIIANPWLVRTGTGFDRGFASFSRVYARGKDTASISATAVTDDAVRALERFGDRRFFAWVHYFDPHMPYEPPPPFARSAASRVMDDFRAKDRDLARIYAGEGYAEADLDDARALYDGEVRYVDAEIGRLLAALERLGRADDTIVVVMSDHGESLGEHGLFFAHDFTLYDELVRVVLAIAGPGIVAARHDDPVSLVDVEPTICRLASLPCRGDVDGRDLLAAPAQPRTLFGAATTKRAKGTPFDRLEIEGFDGRWTMAMRGPLKLVRIPARSGIRYELYDRSSDPGELRDVAATRTAERDELARQLDDWNRSMNAARPPAAMRHRDGRDARKTLKSLGYLQ